MKKSLLLPFLLLVLLVFSACSVLSHGSNLFRAENNNALRLEMNTVFATPNSGVLKAVFVIPKSIEPLLKQENGEDAEQFCKDIGESEEDKGSRVTFNKKGDGYVCTVFIPFKSIDELEDEIGGSDIDIYQIGEKGGKFYYDLMVESDFDDPSSDLKISVVWSVTMPGKVISSNGDKVKGSTVIWDLPTSGSRRLTAVSKMGGTSNTTILIAVLCVGTLVLLVVVAVIVWLVLRSKKQATNQPFA